MTDPNFDDDIDALTGRPGFALNNYILTTGQTGAGDVFNALPDFHLKTGSVAANLGLDASVYTTEDFDGDARPMGSFFDIGADENE